MKNDKPTFARIGKIDDPKVKSKGGPWIFILSRQWGLDEKCIFNIDPDSIFYNQRQAYQVDCHDIVRYETNWQFLKGHK